MFGTFETIILCSHSVISIGTSAEEPMDADLRPSSNRQEDAMPSWTPHSLAFHAPDGTRVFVMNPDAPIKSPSLKLRMINVRVSPNGKQIVSSATASRRRTCRRFEIFVMSSDGDRDGVWQLTFNGAEDTCPLAPNGKWSPSTLPSMAF